MKIAIHQVNFIPWFPFFYKMAMVDKFILLTEAQFEKNNFQNRYYLNSKEKWVTKSVCSGIEPIANKLYADGQSLAQLNLEWVEVIKETLGIKTELCFDYVTNLKGTHRLIDLVHHYGGKTYITNENAKDKYLDENLMWTSGIDIEYCNVPKHLQKHTFEIFEEYGIDGAIKQLPKVKRENISVR